MTVDTHLAELERRHHALEIEIEDALNHPSIDSLTLSELKRRKLLLKEKIEKLKSTALH